MLITSRGWWTATFALALITFGVAFEVLVMTLLGLITLGLVGGTWLVMVRRVHSLANSLSVHADFPLLGPLRLGRRMLLQLRVGGLTQRLVHGFGMEPVPMGRFVKGTVAPVDWKEQKNGEWIGEFAPEPAQLGRAGILGIRFALQDPAGFFVYRGFRPARSEKQVLVPVSVSRLSPRSTRKGSNVLVRSGYFLHEKPGQSMEFLGLRDFHPGDSFRRISWKASMRRDRILIRETEWEVPTMIQCIVDAGRYNRSAVPKSQTRPFEKMAVLAGNLFRRVMGHGNPTGLALVSEHSMILEPAGLGPSHLLRTELAFAEMASLPAPPNATEASRIATWADELLMDLFPELMNPSVNTLPFWYRWMEGFPAYPRLFPKKQPPFSERVDRYRFWFWMAGPLGWLMLLVVFPMTDRKRRISQARKRVAACLTALFSLPAGALERMLQDDAFFVDNTVGGLFQMGIDSVPLGDHETMADPSLQIQQGKRLARAILGRLSLARDHQVFVVILRATPIAFGLSPILDALKRCIARGHRVLVWDPTSTGVATNINLLEQKVTSDLTKTLFKTGVTYWHGEPEDLLARLDVLMRKEGLLGNLRKR